MALLLITENQSEEQVQLVNWSTLLKSLMVHPQGLSVHTFKTGQKSEQACLLMGHSVIALFSTFYNNAELLKCPKSEKHK